MPFRIQARKIALTYSHPQVCENELTKELLADHIGKTREFEYSLIGEELHDNGTNHFHVLLLFSRKRCIRNAREFDWNEWHPNIEPVRNMRAYETYCKKDGSWIERGTGLQVAEDLERIADMAATDLLQAAKECESKIKWLDICVKLKIPYPYAIEFWKAAEGPGATTITEETDLSGGEICSGLENLAYHDDGRTSYVLVGPTGIGKTVWALRNAPKPALFISHIDMLRDFREGFHKSIIFDDMVFDHWPITSQIHLADRERVRGINVRYVVAIIPARTAKFFTCNRRPFSLDDAIDRRLRVFNIFPDTWGRRPNTVNIGGET